ncbi:MAG: dTMP kinase [Patescibacteria group bacterium]
MEKKSVFIVFEGGEGSGKSTQAKLLAEYLSSENHPVLWTREPGGDSGICQDVRGILLNSEYKGKMSFRAELLLFEADRAQHIDRVIKPALEEGKIIICDRYEAATYAYQCAARKVCDTELFLEINGFAAGKLKPNFVFWIDIPPEIGLKRNADIKKSDRFEMEKVEFHQKVREGYKDYFEKIAPPDLWKKLNGELSVKELQRQIANTLKEKQLI